MKKIYTLAALLAFCAFSGTLNAQVVNSLIRETNPADMGVAGATVALDANAFALDNNAAAMSLTQQRMAVGVSYAILQPKSVKMGAISAEGFYRISDRFALGAGFKHYGYQAYPVTSAEGRSSETFKPNELFFSLGASYRIIKGLSAGVNLKYVSMGLASNSKVNVFSADVSALFNTGNLSAGLNVRNIGSKVMDIRAGAAYSIASVKATAQAEYLLGAGFMGALGAEYSLKDIFFARAGVHLGSASKAIPTYGSVGIGVKFIGIRADFCYLITAASIGNSLAFSLGYSF